MSNFKIHFSNPWWLLLLIPALALTLVPYFRVAKKFRRTRNRVLSVIFHATALALCIALIAGMSFYWEVPNRENEMILLVDLSDSNSEQEQRKNEFIQSVLRTGGDQYKIGIVTFGYDTVYAAPLSGNTSSAYEQYISAKRPHTGATDIAAALYFAASQFTKPEAAKIVVLSDGFETDESALAAVRNIVSTGIKVDTVNFSNAAFDEVCLLDVQLPKEMPVVGASTRFSVTVQNNLATEATAYIRITDKDEAGATVPVVLKKGEQTVELEHVFGSGGLHDLTFQISCNPDRFEQNNSVCSYINIPTFENVLILERNVGEADELYGILSEDFNVTVLNIEADADRIPDNIRTLCQYEQIVLVNFSNADLTGQHMPVGFDRMLYDYVYNLGGGLFTVGGANDVGADGQPVAHAYNRADMSGSLFQQMLPVQVVEYRPPMAVMLVIDCSGSMSGTPLEAAVDGALECLGSLGDSDFCGVTGFSDDSTEVISVLPMSQREKIRASITALRDIEFVDSGGTLFAGAIERSGRALAPIPTERKHIILITDGEAADSLDGSSNSYGKFIDRNYENDNITMSIITVRSSTDKDIKSKMQAAADRGHGNYYDIKTSEVSMISTYMRQDLAAIDIPEVDESKEFSPKIKDASSVLVGVDSGTVIPALKGYYGTRIKEGATVPLTHEYVPIYASWQFGNGKVGSFMSTLDNGWAAKFVSDSVGRMLVKNISYSLAPSEDLEPGKLSIILRPKYGNYLSRLDVYAGCTEGERVDVRIQPVSGDAIAVYGDSVPVDSLGDNVGFHFTITQPGVYRVTVEKTDANGNVVSDLTFYRTFSYSTEYNAFRNEEEGSALLAELAQAGGGAVVSDPIDVFAGFVKSLPKTVDPRIAFLIAAIVLMLLDIAVRKFKFKWIHEIVRDRKKMNDLIQEKKDHSAL